MSFRVLVIPEDPTNNGYILKPVVEALVADAGRANPRAEMLTNPKVSGIAHAKAAIKSGKLDKYGFMSLWLFMPDGDRCSDASAEDLEKRMRGSAVPFLCCPVRPEVEILACVSQNTKLGVTWEGARVHESFKETVFAPFLAGQDRAIRDSAGGGRAELTKEGLKNLKSLYKLVPELKALRDRIAALKAKG